MGMIEPPLSDRIAERVREVLARMGGAARKSGRSPDSIKLVAATKSVPVDRIEMGLDAGLTILGENRVQEALSKIWALQHRNISWHFIGQLQRRKVRSIIGRFDLIHSVDGVELAREIDRRAGEAGRQQEVLLEVNIGNEPTKAGFRADDLIPALPALAALSHLRIKGLMAVPPPTAEAEQARPYFAQLRTLAERIAVLKYPSIAMQDLSMGMSHDYEVAIEEGATFVRIGTAIFGARHV
ncbi:YggS family pyridoxal phosphate-dependent enzyme [Nitrospira moscoviensis]|uniref:Pyridoxal phosphate homeostasis protein n=1 Tax=Nitrospira moscoviensis TaxID=42253 RepID=A0A0K2G7W8_NITMO|nr:YggS family pyridoxal phosphate-dependent enzyme [Nitrospira moscoviensis]ALA57066.1 putative enzyme [Nitrospira moscoviensis]